MMWFGAEDLLAHVSYALDFIFDWDDDGPSEGLQAALELSFCGSPCSSFGEIPLGGRYWKGENVRVNNETIFQTVIDAWQQKLDLPRSRKDSDDSIASSSES